MVAGVGLRGQGQALDRGVGSGVGAGVRWGVGAGVGGGVGGGVGRAVGGAVGGGVGGRVGSGVGAAVGVGCEVGSGGPGGGGVTTPLGVGTGGDDTGPGRVAMPLGVGAGGDDEAPACRSIGPASPVDTVSSTIATPGAGSPVLELAALESKERGQVLRSGVTPATGGTKVAGPGPGPDQAGVTITSCARAMRTVKPMSIPTPVCVSFDGNATSPGGVRPV